MKLFNYTHIFWDWNGTLLSDVELCVSIINEMLAERGLRQFESVNEYRGAFCFPVKDYYIKAGFDFSSESFDDIAVIFTDAYYNSYEKCNLHENAGRILAMFGAMGVRQIILSAAEKNALAAQALYYGVEHYFDDILGISNFLAESKISTGIRYMKGKKIEKALLIGDTEHDFETAQGIGADCVLVANGHQKKETLLKKGVPVLDSLSELCTYFKL